MNSMMNEKQFQALMGSVREAGKILRGKAKPARTSRFPERDVQAIGAQTGLPQGRSSQACSESARALWRIGNSTGVNRRARRGRCCVSWRLIPRQLSGRYTDLLHEAVPVSVYTKNLFQFCSTRWNIQGNRRVSRGLVTRCS